MNRGDSSSRSEESGLSFSLNGQTILFTPVQLSSASGFLIASLLTCLICILERILTFLLSSRYYPRRLEYRSSRVKLAAGRASLYWFATMLRLLYMLIAMSFNIGLLIVMVTTLALGQFVIEYLEAPGMPAGASSPIRAKTSVYSPLPTHHSSHHPMQPPSPYIDDVEMAPTPPSSVGGSWLGPASAGRDKARHIMTGAGGSATRLSRGPSGSRLTTSGSNSGTRLTGSALRLNTSGRGPLSPVRSGNSSGAGSATSSAKKALFQIGSEDDERSESD